MQTATGTCKVGLNYRGLTLIEVMMATTIVAIALMSTMSVFVNSERLNSIAHEEALAQAAINQLIAQMRNKPFGNIMTLQTSDDPSLNTGGFTKGDYPAVINRLYPGQFRVNVGGEKMPSGVTTSTTYTQGAIYTAGRWYSPADGVPEMRVIFINDENPLEQELGEVDGNQDGFDLDRDGSIDTAVYDTTGWNAGRSSMNPTGSSVFPDTGVTPLFPRKLAAGTPNPPIHAYLNATQLTVIPVAVQVRWWSRAGVPREISALTFITNRSPTLTSGLPGVSSFDYLGTN